MVAWESMAGRELDLPVLSLVKCQWSMGLRRCHYEREVKVLERSISLNAGDWMLLWREICCCFV